MAGKVMRIDSFLCGVAEVRTAQCAAINEEASDKRQNRSEMGKAMQLPCAKRSNQSCDVSLRSFRRNLNSTSLEIIRNM
jgi:hypothetical protein